MSAKQIEKLLKQALLYNGQMGYELYNSPYAIFDFAPQGALRK